MNEQHSTHKRCISIVPIFNHLTEDEMNEIVKETTSKTYKRGEMLYQPGDESNRLFIVHKGRVKIYRLSENGKEQLVRILEPGDFTGELTLFNETTVDTYAEAVQQTQLCVMERGDFQRFLMQYPAIAMKVLNEFSRRLQQTEEQTAQIALEKVETRLARYLVRLSEEQYSLSFTLPISQRDLASYLGTTPETINRKLNELIDHEIITLHKTRKITIQDKDALLLI